MAKLSKKEKEKYTDAWRKQNKLLSPATIQFDVKKEEEKSSDVLSSALKRAVQENAVQRQAEAKKAVAKAIQDYTPQKVSNVNVAKHSGASLVNDLSSALKQAGQAILEGSFSDLDTYNAARTGNDRWLQMDTSKTDALAEKLAQQRMMTARQAAQQQALIDARYKAQNFSTAQRFASDAGRAIGQVAPALIPGVGTPYLLGLGFGAGTNQAINDGATLEQASDYGALSAAKEVAIEKAFGGLKGMKALINPAKVTDKIANPVLRTGADLALRSAGEGMEEVVATAVDPTLQRMTYNPDAQDASRDEMLYSALLGAIASGGINIGVTGLNKVADFRKNSQTNKGNQKKTVQNQGVSPQSAQNGAGQAQDISASKYLPTPEKPAQNQFMEAEKIRKQMLAEQKQLLSQKRALEQKKAQMEQAELDNLYREIKGLEENIALLRGTQSSAFDDALFNAMDAYTTPQQKENVEPDMPMSERTLDNVSNPKVKAYQSTHPEVKAFFREQAEIMLNDLNNMIDGGREYGIDPETRNVNTVRSQTRAASSQIERLLNAGMTKAQIRDGLERIIRDNGAENTANAKKVETTLDDALANGYQSMQGQVPKNLDYVYHNSDIGKMKNSYNQLNSEESFANSADPAGLINELEYLNQNITERQQLIDAYSELLPDMSVYETMTAEELHDEMDKLENASQYAPNEIAGEMMARHRYLEVLEEGRVNEFIENEGLKTHVENMEKQLADKKLSFELPRASDEMKNIQKKLQEIEAKQAGISIFNKDATVAKKETVPEGYEMLPRPTSEQSSKADSEPDYEDFDVSQLPKEVYDFYDNIGQVGEKAGFNVRIVTGIENDANGRFDGQGNILIDGNKMTDTETINRVVAHEVFHFLKDTDEHKYIIDLAVKNAGVAKDQLIQNKIEDYYNRSKGKVVLDRDGALDEIGAAFMEDVLADPKMADRIWNQNPTLAQRIMRWFEDMVSKFRNTSAKNPNAEIYRKALDAYSRGLRNMQQQNRSQGEGRYALVGKNADEIEVYETSEDIKKLPYSERKKEFLRLMQEEYAGRTARFTVNGENYYARFAEEDLTKNVYGDKRSSPKGWKAKINVGADGGIFDLVENAKYKTSGDEKGKTTKAHKDVKDWDYFVKTVQIDNHVFDLLVNVRKKPDGEFVYSLQLNENKTKKASLPVANPEGNGVRMGAQRSRDIIPENEQKINTGTRYSLPKKMPNQKYIDQSDENLRNFMEGSAVVNEDGSPKVVYSGHGNSSLFGNQFDVKKATAGGFYFTENPEIASSYAKDKLGIKEDWSNGSEYRFKDAKGKYTVKIEDVRLTDEQLERLEELYDEGDFQSFDDYVETNWRFDKEIAALRYNGGKRSLLNLYKFHDFMGDTANGFNYKTHQRENTGFEDIMDHIGIEWDSYTKPSPGVFPVCLNIKNPIDTSEPFPDELMWELEYAARKERPKQGVYGDVSNLKWTKDYPLKNWIEDIKNDDGNTQWATQIPAKARKIMLEMGYDGIKDSGGKGGGEHHTVWIALEPNQIKSATGNRGTYDATKKDMRYSLPSTDTSGRELTEKQANYFKHSKVRDENGALKVMYHGSENGGFTTFDSDYSDDYTSFFFTDSPDVAKSYSGNRRKYNPAKWMYDGKFTVEKMNDAVGDAYQQIVFEDGLYKDIRYRGGFDNYEVEFETPNYNDFVVYFMNTYGYEKDVVWDESLNYEVYLDLRNPLIVDAQGRTWDDLPEMVDEDGIVYNKTRSYAEYAYENDYDGVIFKNIVDNGLYVDMDNAFKTSTVAVAFRPDQIKDVYNAEPTDSGDIRFSLDEMVDEYGAIPKGEDPYGDNRDIDIPQQTADENRVSRFARTAVESRNVHDRTVDMVISDMEQGRFTYEPSGNQEQISRADGLINHTGWEKQLSNFQTKYRSGERMTANDIVLGERLIQEAQRAGDYETAVDLIADIAAIGTELGQAVQALSVLKRLTPEGKVKALKRVEERINAGLVEQGKEPVKLPEGMAEQMLQAESQQMQSDIWDECIQEYANQVDATLADKINAWRYLAMLSNPKTHIRNMVGNGVMRGVSAVKRGIQTGLENRLLTAGEERYAELNRNVPQEYFDFAEWSWENDGKYRAQTGGGRYNDAIGQIEQNKRVFETDALEKARKANTELLEKEDMWFKKKTYVDTLARYMHTNGLSPSALQNTASHANYERGMKFALQEAYKGTFQEASTVANLIARLEHPNTNNKLVAAGAKMLVGGVLPFKKTPINILKRGVEYSPVGLMNGLYKMRRDVQEGNCTKAEAIDNIAAGLTGTGIMILGAFMAHMGWITAGAGEDDERKQWYDQQMGSQNYALVLPNGGTATIDWLAPSVMPLMAGAELYSQLTSENPANENSNAFISLLEAISKVANPALEMSMLQGVTDALQSYNSGTTGVLSDLITSTATSYGGQFIPAPVGAAARTVDDTIRSSYAPKDSKIGKTGEKFVRQQVNKLPVASKMNEPSIDVWGNERKREGGNIVGRAFNNFINPSTYSSNKKTELDEELESLYSATGESSVLPKAADSSFKYQDKTYYMSSKEKTVYDQTKGQKSRQYVSGFVKSSFYRNLSDSQKADIVSELYKLANYQAKKEMLKERGVPYTDDQYEKVLQSKVKPGDYYAMTEAMGDITGDGKKARKKGYLEDQKKAGTINDEQYWYLYMTNAANNNPSKADMAACPYDWIKKRYQ